MDFELKLSKSEIEMMLSTAFGHDVQLEHLILQLETEDKPLIIDFDDDYKFMKFLAGNLKVPKKEVHYYDGNDYSMD